MQLNINNYYQNTGYTISNVVPRGGCNHALDLS